jgi:heavy metal efflux system protein
VGDRRRTRSSFTIAPYLGLEFIPTLDENVINLDVLQVPSISLEQAVTNSTEAEKSLLELPEVDRVVSRIGRPEIATDTTGPDESDVYIFLKPRPQWRAGSKDELLEAIERKLNERVPGMRFGFSQPIEKRVNDMISGVKGDVAIHIYGDSTDGMVRVGEKMMNVLAAIPAAVDLKMIPRTGLPSVNIEIDRNAVARYGINASDVLEAIKTIGGYVVGQVVEGQARYPLQVRFEETARSSLRQLYDIKVASPHGALIPLAELARINVSQGPVAIWRENLSRRITVAANVRGTDLGSFVSAAKSAVASKVELPRGWWLEWGGQYENLQRASTRLVSWS